MARERKSQKNAVNDKDEHWSDQEDIDQGEDQDQANNPYTILGVSKTATTAEVKKAYRKYALLYHPDKQMGKSIDQLEESSAKFQLLHSCYECLIDPSKRKLYDETGRMAESDVPLKDDDVSWKDYFNSIFNRITEEAISEFEKTYKYSEMEIQDVYQAFTKTEGDLLEMIDHVPLSTLDDLDRFKLLCVQGIDKGELQKMKSFPKINALELKKRKAKLVKERKLFESADKKKAAKNDSLGALALQLKANSKARASALIEKLEGDAKAKDSKRKRKAPAPPTEEEFLAIQAKQLKRKNAS